MTARSPVLNHHHGVILFVYSFIRGGGAHKIFPKRGNVVPQNNPVTHPPPPSFVPSTALYTHTHTTQATRVRYTMKRVKLFTKTNVYLLNPLTVLDRTNERYVSIKKNCTVILSSISFTPKTLFINNYYGEGDGVLSRV